MRRFCKESLHLSKWVGAQLAKWREYLVLARSGPFGLREPERTLLASYLSRVSLLSSTERENNFKRPCNKMSDRLNAMHARLAFLVEWCTTSGPPSGVVCSVFCIFIFYLLWQQLQKSDAALPLWVQDRSRNAGGEFVNVVPVPPSLDGTKVRGWHSSHLTLTFGQLVSTSWHKGKQTK